MRRQRGRAAENISAHDLYTKMWRVVWRTGFKTLSIRLRQCSILEAVTVRSSWPTQKTYITGDLSETLLKASDRSRVLVMDEEFLRFLKFSRPGNLVFNAPLGKRLTGRPGQICRALKPDGLFWQPSWEALIRCATFFEPKRRRPVEPTHASPVIKIADTALCCSGRALLSRLSTEHLDSYLQRRVRLNAQPTVWEQQTLAARNRYFLRRDTLFTAAKRYENFSDADGRISATFKSSG